MEFDSVQLLTHRWLTIKKILLENLWQTATSLSASSVAYGSASTSTADAGDDDGPVPKCMSTISTCQRTDDSQNEINCILIDRELQAKSLSNLVNLQPRHWTYLDLSVIVQGLQLWPDYFEQDAPLLFEFCSQEEFERGFIKECGFNLTTTYN